LGRLARNPATWLWIAGFLVSVVTGLLTDHLSGWRPATPWFTIALVVALGVAFWRWREQEQRAAVERERQVFVDDLRQRDAWRQQFALCKPVSDLRPAALGFQSLDPGEEADPQFRPLFPIYVQRRFVPERGGPNAAEAILSEKQVVTSLLDGRAAVVIGAPLEGKSRTLYNFVRSMPDHVVVTPRVDRPVPDDDAFSLVESKRVVVALDDLSEYVGGQVDLALFLDKLRRYSSGLCVVATCRDGPELSAVRQARGIGLARLFESIPDKLRLVPPTAEEKARLASSVGRPSSETEISRYPTLGAITMEDAMAAMAERFQTLPPDHKDVLRALKILLSAGILPLSHRRVSAVMTHVFGRHSIHLGDALDALTECAFLRPAATDDMVRPERAYLASGAVVPYRSGRRLEDDFRLLKPALAEIDDADGLLYLAATSELTIEDRDFPLACLELAVQLAPSDKDLASNLGMVLGRAGRPEDAFATFDQVLRNDPSHVGALMGRALLLVNLDRHAEALDALDVALDAMERESRSAAPKERKVEREQDPFRALYDRGVLVPARFGLLTNRALTLASLERNEEALAGYERALKVLPNEPITLANKSRSLSRLGRYEEAIRAAEHSLRVRPDAESTLEAKAHALSALGRYDEALAIYDDWAGRELDGVWATHGRAASLLETGRHEAALPAFEKVLEAVPTSVNALQGKAAALTRMGRDKEAVEVYGEAARVAPERADLWANRGLALTRVGRLAEALSDFDRALTLDLTDAATWTNRGVTLSYLGMEGDAVAAYDRALAIDPEYAVALFNKRQSLLESGRLDEALEMSRALLAVRADDADDWAGHASICRDLGRLDEALHAYNRTLDLTPGHLEATVNKSFVLLEMKVADGYDGEDAVEWLCRSWLIREHFVDEVANEIIRGLKYFGLSTDRCHHVESEQREQ
jgi:tetratricopeptide (TPR) repeat protein